LFLTFVSLFLVKFCGTQARNPSKKLIREMELLYFWFLFFFQRKEIEALFHFNIWKNKTGFHLTPFTTFEIQSYDSQS